MCENILKVVVGNGCLVTNPGICRNHSTTPSSLERTERTPSCIQSGKKSRSTSRKSNITITTAAADAGAHAAAGDAEDADASGAAGGAGGVLSA